METLTEIFDALPVWIEALTALVAGATAITALTPTNWDNKMLNSISKVLNIVAGNVLRNKNADDNND